MASATGGGWLKGRVKGVQSGDSLIITALTRTSGPPLEKNVTLSSLIAPRLARRGTIDEPFAWDSRMYLRNLCIGKEVTFKVEYTINGTGFSRDFGSIYLGDKNLAVLVVSTGWAKVKQPQGAQKDKEPSPYVQELRQFEEQAQTQGLGIWSKVPGAAQASIRDLPPSAVGDPTSQVAQNLLAANKGRPMECFVEQVRDGSSLRVYVLPEFQFVQVLVAGAQAPQAGRRAPAPEPAPITDVTSGESNGVDTNEAPASLTSAQRLQASAAATSEISADPFGLEAKYFTEMRTLHRDVRIVLETYEKGNLVGSVFYPDGETAKDLGMELMENGLARYVEWSGKTMEEEAKRRLKAAELEAKKSKLKMWINYVPPVSNSKAIQDENFTGKVVEVVSGDCVVVADDSIPYGSPMAERRVNLSSIRCPKMGNPRKEEKPAAFAREAKELLRTRLIGRQVKVEMEYSRKVIMADGAPTAPGSTDARVMDFGSVFLVSPVKNDGNNAPAATPAATDGHPPGSNVAELIVGRGYGTVINHRDFEERSSYFDALQAAESRAKNGKKGIHSQKEPPVMHITDLVASNSKKARDFLPFLQRSRRIPAIVEYVFSGHRFKLQIPKETCSIAFSFSGVRCPGRDEPYSEEAIALMRRKILQRDVEIEVETVDRTGTFLGSMWESKHNVAITLLEAGLAKLQTSFGSDRIPEVHLLERAEQSAKKQKLKVWENFVEGQEVPNGSTVESKKKEVLKVTVTEVLGGGRFYVQTVGDQKVTSIQNQLASLNLNETPLIGAFNPKKGDIVLAQFSADNSWNRAMIVNAPRGVVASPQDKFEVFYIDYGNQEVVTFSQLRPADPSVSSASGLAQLCSLAFIKVPSLEEDFGQEAGEFLHDHTLSSPNELIATVEERDASGGKQKGQGTGTVLLVTLRAADSEESINAAMLEEGLARLEKRKRWDSKDRQAIFDNLETCQEKARTQRVGMWEYGDIQSDDEDTGPPSRKPAAAGRR